ncbi:MAG TPA: PadR family transcriptional regulator [Gemmatimonadaceae bacterium]|nr:PadR family transcriptional regulator [Gemmatimonadaceae bacterium]
MPRLTYPTSLVLVAVSRGYRYGFDIIEACGLPSGTVYPILRRLEDAGLLRSRWEGVRTARDEQRPPRRYYQLNASGTQAVRMILERYPNIIGALEGEGPAARPRPA